MKILKYFCKNKDGFKYIKKLKESEPYIKTEYLLTEHTT